MTEGPETVHYFRYPHMQFPKRPLSNFTIPALIPCRIFSHKHVHTVQKYSLNNILTQHRYL